MGYDGAEEVVGVEEEEERRERGGCVYLRKVGGAIEIQ